MGQENPMNMTMDQFSRNAPMTAAYSPRTKQDSPRGSPRASPRHTPRVSPKATPR